MAESKTTTAEDGEMDLFDHLRELRKRLLICFALVSVGAIGCYYFSEQIFRLLSEPYYKSFANSMLIGTSPAEAFVLKIKLAFFCGVLVTSPLLFLQLWLFISPGMYDEEKKLFVPFLASTTILFLLGVVFCYWCVLPFAFDFFHEQYVSLNVTPAIKVSEHLSMMAQGLLGFGVVFEMPVLAYFLGRLDIIDDRMLIEGTRYAIVIIFIVAAVLTPPDVFTQFLMAGPLLVLYGLSILVVRYTKKIDRGKTGS